MKHRNLSIVATVLLLAAATVAVAQEPTFMDAATHPGAGQFYSRVLFSGSEYEEEGTNASLSTGVLKLSYGVKPTLAIVFEGELANLSMDDNDDAGLSLTTLLIKYRLFKKDLGPLNTWRTSVLGGVTIPGDMDAYGPDDTYPRCALVSTAILGRHGMNAEIEWEEYGDEPDRFAVNASHLFRLSPSEYTMTTRGAWYTMLESLNDFTDEEESRSDVAVGILYEARRWAWEASIRLPVAQDWPQENDYTYTTGLRFLH